MKCGDCKYIEWMIYKQMFMPLSYCVKHEEILHNDEACQDFEKRTYENNNFKEEEE